MNERAGVVDRYRGLVQSPNLAGQVALVTGANRGLGFEAACGLAAAGAHVLLHGRDLELTRKASEQIPGSEPLTFDLADRNIGRTLLQTVFERHGRIDILIGNAGIRDRSTFLDTSTDTLVKLLDINLIANFELAKQIAPRMIDSGGGRIVFITTGVVSRTVARGATYVASKAGLDGLMRALAVELGPHNIRVNSVCPGFVATEFNKALFTEPSVAAVIDRRVPLRRWGQPSEIVGPILFLVSEASSYITGHTLFVDGGIDVSA